MVAARCIRMRGRSSELSSFLFFLILVLGFHVLLLNTFPKVLRVMLHRLYAISSLQNFWPTTFRPTAISGLRQLFILYYSRVRSGYANVDGPGAAITLLKTTCE